MVPALANASIDAAVLLEPLATTATTRGAGVLWKPLWEFYPQQQVAVIMYGPNLIERDPDLGRRWMLAYVRGLRLYNDAYAKNDPAVRGDVTAVLAEHTRTAPALVEEIAGAGRLPGLEPDGRVNAEALRWSSAYWRQTGTQTVDVDVDQLLDGQYVDHAVQVLGPYW
jgi:NitT/TauT family transport system substrate-binding protein